MRIYLKRRFTYFVDMNLDVPTHWAAKKPTYQVPLYQPHEPINEYRTQRRMY